MERKPRPSPAASSNASQILCHAIVHTEKPFFSMSHSLNLDAKLRVEVRALKIKKLHLRLQTTTIYVTHDQEEAMTLGDRIVVMKDGIIQQCLYPWKSTTAPPTVSSPDSSARLP